MLSNFFTGFDIPSIFDEQGIEKRRKKFEKHFHKQNNFLTHWVDDFDLFSQPTPAEIKENKLKQLKLQEQDIQERQKAVQQYLENLKKQEKDIRDKHEELQKVEVPKEQEPKKERPNPFKAMFETDDEIDKLFEQFTKPSKKAKKEEKNEEKKDQMEEEKKEGEPPKLSKEQSIVRQEENTSKLNELKQKLAEQGFKCKENDGNDDKHWVVGKKKFVNDKNEKEKQVFYQMHDKSNPNCNYSGYSKQIRDDAGNFSTVKKSVYHYENL